MSNVCSGVRANAVQLVPDRAAEFGFACRMDMVHGPGHRSVEYPSCGQGGATRTGRAVCWKWAQRESNPTARDRQVGRSASPTKALIYPSTLMRPDGCCRSGSEYDHRQRSSNSRAHLSAHLSSGTPADDGMDDQASPELVHRPVALPDPPDQGRRPVRAGRLSAAMHVPPPPPQSACRRDRRSPPAASPFDDTDASR